MNKKNIDDSIYMSGNVIAQRRWGKIRDTLKTPLGKRGTTRPRQYWPEGEWDELDEMEMRKRQRANAQSARGVFTPHTDNPYSFPEPVWPTSRGGYGTAPYPLLNGGDVLDVASGMAFELAPDILRGGAKRKKSKSKGRKSKSKSKSKSKGRKSKGRKTKGRKSKGRKSKGRKSKGRKSKGRKSKGRKSKSKRK